MQINMYACEIKYLGSNPLIKANHFGEGPEQRTCPSKFLSWQGKCANTKIRWIQELLSIVQGMVFDILWQTLVAKNINKNVYRCITKSLCRTAETGTMLWVNKHSSKRKNYHIIYKMQSLKSFGVQNLGQNKI